MSGAIPRFLAFGLVVLAVSACGGAGAGGGGLPTEPTSPAIEIVDERYIRLSDRSQSLIIVDGMAYRLLEGQTLRADDFITFSYSDGQITGGLLNLTDIDSGSFTNPANGEFSRVVRISGESIFGVVGLDVLSGDLPSDLPTSGTVSSYNEGWVGLTAIFEEGPYVLEGDATFTATWATNDIDGRFFNLSGTDPLDAVVTNVGTINLNNAVISGDNFTGGSVTGTGVFSPLSGSSNTSGTAGTFFGPQADELGGILRINDAGQDIFVLGVFQAD